MFLIELNKNTRENYAFYDPSAPIRLTLSEPRGYAPRLTTSILTGLRSGSLIDVEGKVDIEKGMLKEELPKDNVKIITSVVLENKNEEVIAVRDIDKTIEKPKRKTKK